MAEILSEEVAELLRCPVSGQRIRTATPEELQRFPGTFAEGGFVTEDGKRLYPVRDGFPMLVESESVITADHTF